MVFTLQKNDFTLKDEQRCGRSKGLNSEELLAVINEDPSKTSRKLGIEFNVSHTSIPHEMARLVRSLRLENGFHMNSLETIANNVLIFIFI